MSNLPAGFVLDQAPSLPAGFVLDEQPGVASRMVSDVVPEIKGAFNENLGAFKRGFGLEGPRPGEKGIIEGTLDVGKGLMAIPGMAVSPITGAARSLIGHPMASLIHTIGGYVNPEVAAKQSHQELYEDAKGGVDQAMLALAPRTTAPRAGPPSAVELRQAAKDVWNSPQAKALQISPADAGNVMASIEHQTMSMGARPTPGSAPGTFGEIERFKKTLPGAQSVSVDDLRAVRTAFKETAKQVGQDFKPTTDARAATQAIHRIDDFLDALHPQLREANANYAAGSRSEMVDYRTIRADRNAAKSGSGMNIENTLRQAVDKIGDRGLSKAEIALRDKIVLGDTKRNALRIAGKSGVDGGLSLALHTAAALSTGGQTLPITAVGTLARKLGETMTRSQIKQLDTMIRNRSPLAQALIKNPPSRKINSRAKTIAAALLTENAQYPVIPGMMPAYADQNKR